MYGMTEEQFWHSNPAKIKVYAEAWKQEQKRQNEVIHTYVGTYVLSALTTAIDGVLNGKKSKAKYIEKPIQLFELTEKEKEEEQRKAREAFLAWANLTKSKYKDRKEVE